MEGGEGKEGRLGMEFEGKFASLDLGG